MFNSTFKIIYFILFAAITTVRRIYTGRLRKTKMVMEKRSGAEIFFMVLNSIGMLIPLIYVFTSWLDFANYELPDWIGWLGTALFLDAVWILFLSHRDLGRHWSVMVGLREDHQLITTGIYRYLRHPMYAAHFVWAIAQILMLHNWIAGFSFFVTMLPFYIYRKTMEDQMLKEEFGQEYLAYKQKTGALFPKL